MFNPVAPKINNLFGNTTPIVDFTPGVISTSYSQPKSKGSGMIGGILQGVSSLFNSFASIGAGKRQARRQKEVAEHNYNLQMQAYERQLADQERLIAEEREYNDFASVAKRARDAGFNPNAVVGTASGGNVSTSTPSLDAPQMQASPIDPLMQVGSSIQSAIDAFNQAEMVRAQIKAQKIANANAEAELKDKDRQKAHEIAMDEYEEKSAELNNVGVQLDNELKSLSKQSATTDLEIKQTTKESVIKLADTNLQIANQTFALNEQQLKKNEIDFKTYEKRVNTELEHLNASIFAIYKSAQLKEKELKLAFMNTMFEHGYKKDSFEWQKSMDIRNYMLSIIDSVRSAEEFSLKMKQFLHEQKMDDKFDWSSIWGVLSSVGNAIKSNPSISFPYRMYENSGYFAQETADSLNGR